MGWAPAGEQAGTDASQPATTTTGHYRDDDVLSFSFLLIPPVSALCLNPTGRRRSCTLINGFLGGDAGQARPNKAGLMHAQQPVTTSREGRRFHTYTGSGGRGTRDPERGRGNGIKSHKATFIVADSGVSIVSFRWPMTARSPGVPKDRDRRRVIRIFGTSCGQVKRPNAARRSRHARLSSRRPARDPHRPVSGSLTLTRRKSGPSRKQCHGRGPTGPTTRGHRRRRRRQRCSSCFCGPIPSSATPSR